MGIEMEIGGLKRRCGACDGCGVDGVCFGASGFWTWEKEEERRGRKERGNGRDNEKERKKKEKEVLEKKCVGEIILKKEYKNIIYIKYLV